MGVLQRFERRLGGLVEGAFAKVFKGGVEPVEIAGALARETDDRRAISSNRVLVPNEFGVELASGDYARLSPYSRALCDELAEMVREHAAEQRYTFVGPVNVRLAEASDLDVGVFRIRSSVASADPGVIATAHRGPRAAPGAPRLLITNKEAPPGQEREYALAAESTLIGRSVECDIRLTDTGVSRRHGEIRQLPDGNFLYVDAGSTNGSIVNGRPATQVKLVSGDLIELGSALITFEREDARGREPGRAAPSPSPDPYARREDPRGPGADPYRAGPGGRPERERRDPYPDRSSPRNEPYRRSADPPDRLPRSGRDPAADPAGSPGRPERRDPYADRSSPRNEPYRDRPAGPRDPYADRSGPRNERYRDAPHRPPAGPRDEPYRDAAPGAGRGPRDERDARSRRDPDGDLYPGAGDGHGPGRRAERRPDERPRGNASRPPANGRDGRPGGRGAPAGPGGPARSAEPAREAREPIREVRDGVPEELYDAETQLPGRAPARPRADDDRRRRPGSPPPNDRSW
ncbi:DUF3662 domain-containing protein [Frankia sp. CNm7]|uniref:DUF3662 domain-containing protein n=1 Tax=Frankia nepalensis TaxID=1836974 RepID=A0A937RHV5_9ACTN|nr:FhaA domain-containing protein [Frankia nepalensis]MBL7494890.1 DUF3662 domain-containing protein [Frankia nepalensis]MBL7515649.1 DUF3662 domain-containing protein [Frankia nepalensis]MBL7521181.1 DUF3662 domain-containing protein [Frankia nepalensis]MBL7626663.1 DUF3662 domain-containing protein [Frankia nepalensis]